MGAKRQQTQQHDDTITRADVAKRLKRDVSWVRRREGKDLHPTLRDGANRFDPDEVEQLRQRLESENLSSQAAQETVARVHDAFMRHATAPDRFTIDGLAERHNLEPRLIRSMHEKWAEDRKSLGEPTVELLTRAQLRRKQQRELDEAEREHRANMAAMDRDFEKRRREREVQRARDDQEQAARDAERKAKRAQLQTAEAGRLALEEGRRNAAIPFADASSLTAFALVVVALLGRTKGESRPAVPSVSTDPDVS